jgi:hypothetical protein
MTVKTLQLRKNLKQILEATVDQDVFLNYYGELYQIVRVNKSGQTTQAQRVIQKFTDLPAIDSEKADFLDENNPSQEKENIQNLITKKYV